jgi:hypothetical protein
MYVQSDGGTEINHQSCRNSRARFTSGYEPHEFESITGQKYVFVSYSFETFVCIF